MKTNPIRLRNIASNLERFGKEACILQEWRDLWQSEYCINGRLFWQGRWKAISWKSMGGGCGFILTTNDGES